MHPMLTQYVDVVVSNNDSHDGIASTVILGEPRCQFASLLLIRLFPYTSCHTITQNWNESHTPLTELLSCTDTALRIHS